MKGFNMIRGHGGPVAVLQKGPHVSVFCPRVEESERMANLMDGQAEEACVSFQSKKRKKYIFSNMELCICVSRRKRPHVITNFFFFFLMEAVGHERNMTAHTPTPSGRMLHFCAELRGSNFRFTRRS